MIQALGEANRSATLAKLPGEFRAMTSWPFQKVKS